MRGGTVKRTTTVIVVGLDENDVRQEVPRTVGAPWNYVPITPFNLHRAHGVKADELMVTRAMRDSPELQPILAAIAPCFARAVGGAKGVLERAEVTL